MVKISRCLVPFLVAMATLTACNRQEVPSGPFGLSKGMTYSQVKSGVAELSEVGPELYSSHGTIHPGADFPDYLYLITNENGLCVVWASTKDVVTNDFGDQLKARYIDIQKQLSDKYGSGRTIDELKSGSIWKGPSEFTIGLQKKERVLETDWDMVAPGGTLPNNIKEITLQARASDYNKGSLLLTYTFDNFDECVRVRHKSQSERNNL